MLPGLSEAAGSQKRSGSDLRGEWTWYHAGGSRIITFTNCLQGNRGNGPEPFWSLVFRSMAKSPKEHVMWFRQVDFNSAKLYEGTPEKQVGPGHVKMRIKQSPPSRSLQFKSYLGTGQVQRGYSGLHLNLSSFARTNEETQAQKRKVTWWSMQWIIV